MTSAAEGPTLEERIAALEKVTKPVELSDADFRLGLFLYGQPGSGKTDLAIKILGLVAKKICLVYTDRNWTVILKYPDLVERVEKRIPFGGLSTIHTIIDARESGHPDYQFDAILWDTASTGIKIGLRNLVKVHKFPKDQYHSTMEARPHYLMMSQALTELLAKINKTDLHMVYTAHLREPKEADLKKGKTALRPAMAEASFDVLAEHSNLIGYLHKQNSGGQRLIQLSGTESVIAKAQIPNIDEKTYKVQEIPVLIKEWLEKSQ